MRPKEFDIDPANVDADGLAAANSSAGATVTLDGALTSGGSFTSADGIGRKLDITDVGGHNQATATYTITGTDENGKAYSESLAGPGISSTVSTTGFFTTVTSVAIASPTASSTVNIGTNDEIAHKTIPVDYASESQATVAVDVTGTINYTVYETFDDIQESEYAVQAAHWFAITALSGKTADTVGQASVGATAIRFITNSYTDTAEAQMHVSQPSSRG